MRIHRFLVDNVKFLQGINFTTNCALRNSEMLVKEVTMFKELVKKKAKSAFPVAVEGVFLKRADKNIKDVKTWLDRQIGYQNRITLANRTKVKKHRVLFITFQHSYACNPRFICEAMLRRDDKAEIIWAVDNVNGSGLPNDPRIKAVKINSYEYFEAAVTAHVIIINSLLGDKWYPFPKKQNQIVFETWHGSLGIKRFDPAHYNTNVSWPEAAKRTGELTNYCISNSQFEEDVFRETFWKDTEILRLGHARNDVFFDTYKEQRQEWKDRFMEEYDLEKDVKFCLYAPTFRDNHDFDLYDIKPEPLLRALSKRFGGQWKLLVRYHDNDKKNGSKKNTIISPDVIDVTKYPDIQELLAFVDCGITDYSSWIYDFILSRKPGFIYAKDIDMYNDERGFYFKLEDTPFPVASDNETLCENVRSFDMDKFQAGVDSFLGERDCMDDGYAGERIAEKIMEAVNSPAPSVGKNN